MILQILQTKGLLSDPFTVHIVHNGRVIARSSFRLTEMEGLENNTLEIQSDVAYKHDGFSGNIVKIKLEEKYAMSIL